MLDLPPFLLSKNPHVNDMGVNPVDVQAIEQLLASRRPTLLADNIEKVSANIDYITLTFKGVDMDFMWQFQSLACDLVDMGELAYEHSIGGGYKGIKVGSVFLGKREAYIDDTGSLAGNDYIISAAGAVSQVVFDRFTGMASNCSRLDVALTVWLKQYDYDLPRDIHTADNVRRVLGLQRTVNGHPVTVTLQDDTKAGSTCYVGSTKSDVLGRVYLKELAPNATEVHKGAVRYELQYRHGFARQAWLQLAQEKTGFERFNWIASAVLTWFSSKFVWVPALDTARRVFISVEKRVTDMQKKWAWVKRQVVPTLRLLAQMGYGHRLLGAVFASAEYVGEWVDYKMRAELLALIESDELTSYALNELGGLVHA